MKPAETVKKRVNVLGLSLSDFKGRENAREIRRLLEAAGLEVVAMPGAGSRWGDLMAMPTAELNIVVRPELAAKAAEHMEKAFHVPYLVTGLPAGIDGTLCWLRTIQEAIPAMELTALTQEADERRRRLDHRSGNLQSLWGQLWFDEILIAAWPSDAASLAEAVRGEWADTGRLIVHQQEPSDQKIPAADAVRTVRADEAAIEADYAAWQGGLLLGSSHETTRLARLGKTAEFVPVSRPVYEELLADDTPLYGFAGAARLLERIFHAGIEEKKKRKR